jgi:hypothetical protein
MKALPGGQPDGSQHIGYDMCRRNKIDIVAAHFLQPEHYLSQFPVAHLLALEKVGYVVILAENALQVAACKKDGP